MILTALKSGIAQMWANKRLVLVFYLANLFFGLILMLPFRAAVSKFIGFSFMSEKLGQRFDMDFLFEFIKYGNISPSTIAGMMMITAAAYWLFMLFLSGGAFSIFANDEKYMPNLFWGSAAKYFGRFIRLALWSLPVFAILFCLQFLWTAIERLFFGSDPYQYISYWGNWLKVGLRYISIILFGLVLDYARVYTVQFNEHVMRKALWQGIKFIFSNLLQTFSLALLLFIIGAIAVAIYYPIANILSAPYAFILILLFLLQQLYIFFRMMLRLTLYSSQLKLYRTLSSNQESDEVYSRNDMTDDLSMEGAVV